MVKKKPSKSRKKSSPKPKKQVPKPKEVKKPEKIVITPSVKRSWLKIRRAWVLSHEAFTSTISYLSNKEANELYDVIKHSLFKNSYADMLREHPELREIVRSDDDRLCMHDIYEILSWRLGRREELPKSVQTKMKMQGRIGRNVPSYS